MLAGFTTSQTSVCLSCHSGSAHSKAEADPHQSVRCVSCHEQGGILGSLTSAVPRRAAHFATGILNAGPRVSYGSTSRRGACLGCHRVRCVPPSWCRDRGIRISHREPLDAGAECLDCHALADGAVSNRTTGMAPCLQVPRRHDRLDRVRDLPHQADGNGRRAGTVGEQAGSWTVSASPTAAPATIRRRATPVTGSACRTPRHSWLTVTRAREPRISGTTAERAARSATPRPGVRAAQCHLNAFGQHPVKEWRKSHGAGGANNNACICHDRMAYIKGRNFCSLCHEVTQKDGVWQLAPE